MGKRGADDADDGGMVFQIRFTGEVFPDYESYITTLDSYLQRVWICSVTMKKGLTYEEALASEASVRARLHSLPPPIVEAIAREVHMFVGKLEVAIDQAFKAVSVLFVPGEILRLRHKSGSVLVKVVQSDAAGNKFAVKPEDPDLVVTKSGEELTVARVKQDQATLAPLDRVITVPAEALVRRSGGELTRNSLRELIRALAARDTYAGAPWMLLKEYADKYGLSLELPELLEKERLRVVGKRRKAAEQQDKKASGAASSGKAEKQPKAEEVPRVRFPIDDKLVDKFLSEEQRKERAEMPAIPPSLIEFPHLEPDDVAPFLDAFSFLHLHPQFLELTPFTMQEFLDALRHDDECELIVESHCALLFPICDSLDKSLSKRLEKDAWKHWQRVAYKAIKLLVDRELEHRQMMMEAAEIAAEEAAEAAMEIDQGNAKPQDAGSPQNKAAEGAMDEGADENDDEEDDENAQDDENAIFPRPLLRSLRLQDHLDLSVSDKLKIYTFLISAVVESAVYRKKHQDLMVDEIQEVRQKFKALEQEARAQLREDLEEADKGSIDKLREAIGDVDKKLAELKVLMENDMARRDRLQVQEQQRKLEEKRQRLATKIEQLDGFERKRRDEMRAKARQLDEKLSRKLMTKPVRAEPLGRDRDFNRYWFMPTDNRVLIENPKGAWAYYDSIEQVEVLYKALDDRGIRERALKRALDFHWQDISQSMRQSAGRKATRNSEPSFLAYDNQM